MSLFGEVAPVSRDEELGDSPRQKTLADVDHAYHLWNDDSAIDALINELAAASVYSFDTETTGLDAMDAEIVGNARFARNRARHGMCP